MKIVNRLAVSALLTVLLFSCNNAGSNQLTAPNTGGPETLAPTGATSNPSDKDESLYLFKTAVSEVDQSSSTQSNRTITENVNLNWSSNGLDLNGTAYTDIFYDSAALVNPVNNSWINPLFTLKHNFTAVGTLTDTAVGGNTATPEDDLIVNGRVDITTNVDQKVDYFYSVNPLAIERKANLKLSVAYGATLSVLRADGVGAKYVVSFAENSEFNNTLTALDVIDATSNFYNNFKTEIDKYTVNIKVYDDNNTLIGDYNVSMDEFINSYLN